MSPVASAHRRRVTPRQQSLAWPNSTSDTSESDSYELSRQLQSCPPRGMADLRGLCVGKSLRAATG